MAQQLLRKLRTGIRLLREDRNALTQALRYKFRTHQMRLFEGVESASRALHPHVLFGKGKAGSQGGVAPRLLVDVTSVRTLDHQTGIQRVVKGVLSALLARDDTPKLVQPVYHNGKAIRCSNRLPFIPQESAARLDIGALRFRRGDDLLMLDASWPHYQDYLAATRNSEVDLRTYTVVYDLIPVLYDFSPRDEFRASFAAWLHAAVEHSDGLICISRAVADELIQYVGHRNLPHRAGLRIGWFHLGSDGPASASTGPIRDELRQALSTAAPTFLMVGTIEPRKGHAMALRAMERLWAEQVNARLCILGKMGWRVDEFIAGMRDHPEFGQRLYWIDDPSDAEVMQAYRTASALLFPSVAEGYGLPIVEAASVGLPVLCSDIPVFREIARDGALYFDPRDPASIAGVLRNWLALRPQLPAIRTYSWAESAQQLVDVIYGGNWYEQLGPGDRLH